MDGKLYCPVKIFRLILSFLLVAGLLGFSVAFPSPQQRQEGGDFNSFTAFRKARMKLPERDDSLCPVAVEELMHFWNNVREVKEYGCPSIPLPEVKRFVHGIVNAGGNKGAPRVALNGQSLSMASEKLVPEDAALTTGIKDAFGAGDRYLFGVSGFLPQYRLVQSRDFDLDGNGIREKYVLRNGRVTVKDGSRIIWQSEDDWWVDYFFVGDANNDGVLELNLLVWKEGSFGPYRPFWIEEEDLSVKNHLFIFKLEKETFKPVWQSSNLDRPNYCAALIDINSDGENELVVLEGSYTDPKRTEVTLWKWNGWGFTRIDLDLAE
ncbi:MAG TPA: hypothetical protein GX004_07100 [Firmicutes bacterium]|jgi:hypothetical protein|nr:hypothetical protein [Bacillota bacterium]